jgi:DNA mismatch repair ATPase MutS
VEKGISEVAAAPLPGILRDKRTAWEEGVKKLQRAGTEYREAAAARDAAGLLAAAETLHARFEGLMRTIRPALRELDDFHAVLYMLYHYYLPKYDLEKIRSSAVQLKEKMTALNAARLPARLEEKEAEFQAARSRLSESVDSLEIKVKSNDEKSIKEAVELMHSNYQALEKLF